MHIKQTLRQHYIVCGTNIRTTLENDAYFGAHFSFFSVCFLPFSILSKHSFFAIQK